MNASQEVFNEIAWRDFVMFAWSQEEAHVAFRGASGRPQRSKTGSPLDLLIYKAVGGAENAQYVEDFVRWVTEEHWGENFAPKKWRKRQKQTANMKTLGGLESDG